VDPGAAAAAIDGDDVPVVSADTTGKASVDATASSAIALRVNGFSVLVK